MDHGAAAHGGSMAGGLPVREPVDHQVAVGAVAGLTGGAAMWLAAMVAARSDQGFLFPLRLVAASFMGEAALDGGALVGPALLGVLLIALTSVLFGLIYTSILPEGVDVFGAMLVGIAYAAALWLVAWFVMARVLDPILYAAGRPAHMLALHAFYGAVLGLLVPFLRKVLP
jgi:hypothetical protein